MNGDEYFDDKELELAKDQDAYSRERLVYMSPADFLLMAENGES